MVRSSHPRFMVGSSRRRLALSIRNRGDFGSGEGERVRNKTGAGAVRPIAGAERGGVGGEGRGRDAVAVGDSPPSSTPRGLGEVARARRRRRVGRERTFGVRLPAAGQGGVGPPALFDPGAVAGDRTPRAVAGRRGGAGGLPCAPASALSGACARTPGHGDPGATVAPRCPRRPGVPEVLWLATLPGSERLPAQGVGARPHRPGA